MTVYACYEKRRGELLRKLGDAPGLAHAAQALRESFDLIQYEYCENCKDERLREQAAYMMTAAKTGFPLLECASGAQVWRDEPVAKKTRRRGRLAGFVLLACGLVALVGFALALLSQSGENLGGALEAVGVLAVACAALFASGLLLRGNGKGRSVDKVEITADAADLVRRLSAVIMQIDKNLTAFQDEEARRARESGEISLRKDELELFAALLEAGRSDSPELVLEQLADAEHFLYARGVELCDYTPERARWFELLPADETRTLRPAMFSGGKLLKKGLATDAEEGA